MVRAKKTLLFKRSGEISQEERDHLTRIGGMGGKSRSANKLRAIQDNLKKAMAKRFPNNPKWKLTVKG